MADMFESEGWTGQLHSQVSSISFFFYKMLQQYLPSFVFLKLIGYWTVVSVCPSD